MYTENKIFNIQLFKHDNTLRYTAAQELKPGMTEFPKQLSSKIAGKKKNFPIELLKQPTNSAGMTKLIEMKPDAAKMGPETDVKISEDRWKQLIYDEIKHVL